ncbi:MAG TPA: hypothetical protein VHH73_07785 [Verrucomicrobiae bacterium]|nr:hypothetical protein [Verrucomicrobiae bacterium]
MNQLETRDSMLDGFDGQMERWKVVEITVWLKPRKDRKRLGDEWREIATPRCDDEEITNFLRGGFCGKLR